MQDAVVSEAQRHDPAGRDGCRAPIPWTAAPPHGWSGADPWLPWPPEPATINPEVQGHDPDSILNLYRRILAIRRSSAALRTGAQRLHDGTGPVLTFDRTDGDEVITVAINMSDEAVAFDRARRTVVLSSRAGGATESGRLEPWEACILTGD
jgi:alpha-glucosidase